MIINLRLSLHETALEGKVVTKFLLVHKIQRSERAERDRRDQREQRPEATLLANVILLPSKPSRLQHLSLNHYGLIPFENHVPVE